MSIYRCGRCGRADHETVADAMDCCAGVFPDEDEEEEEDGGHAVPLPDGGVSIDTQRAEIASAGRGGVGDQTPPECPHGSTDCQGPGGGGVPCWQCMVDGGDA